MKLTEKVSKVKEEISHGTLYLDSKSFPFVKDLKLNEEAEMMIKVKIKSLRSPDNWEITEKKLNPKDVLAQVNISKIEHKGSGKKEKSEDN